ncbi:hypothetical protein BO78DRAFT_106808 [Aspergillus sclerotiicarbonarius CBS 121057]|uniref:Uncharacterized protein n=1 Tax=Aspergillus sclerotiicarbonarius (strain CBS 121057 / IBT 28362) TaxID=1448318 RepID=A0A319EGK2_ASPSB|nr:hypothetical protein BO78DRAFT_106808 [Aspergillus sclerotiicarbonarius CBS 121057]
MTLCTNKGLGTIGLHSMALTHEADQCLHWVPGEWREIPIQGHHSWCLRLEQCYRFCLPLILLLLILLVLLLILIIVFSLGDLLSKILQTLLWTL